MIFIAMFVYSDLCNIEIKEELKIGRRKITRKESMERRVESELSKLNF